MASPVSNFKSKVDAFLKRYAMAPTKFGRVALNDSNFYNRLANGRFPTLRTVEAVEVFMRNYVPPKRKAKRATAA